MKAIYLLASGISAVLAASASAAVIYSGATSGSSGSAATDGPALYSVGPAQDSTTVITRSGGGMVITPTFTANFNADFGANATAAQNAWIAAANVFSSHFTDNININITVDATATTSPFGQSNTSLYSSTYATFRALMAADAKTPDDATALGVNGSMSATDPSGGAGTWWVTRAQAKAIGLIANDSTNDGTTTFGAGNPFSFSGTPSSGFYDFQGVAAHEISEVMGRLGLGGATIGGHTPSYSLIDDFAYTGLNAKNLGKGPSRFFSIDGGTSLLKQYNDASSNGLDVVDWASGTNDAFNQFSNSGVLNPVSAVDFRLLDAIGYDLAVIPEPGTALFGAALLGACAGFRRRSRAVIGA